MISNRVGDIIKCPPARPLFLFSTRTMGENARYVYKISDKKNYHRYFSVDLNEVSIRCPHHIMDFDTMDNLKLFLSKYRDNLR